MPCPGLHEFKGKDAGSLQKILVIAEDYKMPENIR